jgi:hypothetical protein
MNDDLMLEYLLQTGAMSPEEERLARRQAQVNALRQQSMQPIQGGMAGRVYVGPSLTQGLAQLGQAYGARKGQEKVDTDYGTFNKKQGEMLRDLQQRMALRRAGNAVVPGAPIPEDDEETRSRYGGWYSMGS